MFETLNKLWHAAPFEPFTVHLMDGRSLNVPHPDFCLVVPKSGMVVIVDEKGHIHSITGRGIVSVSQKGEQVAP